MRKYTFINCLMMAGLMIGFVFMTSCEGPQGPAGPAGPAGPQGVQGPAGADGTPGVDGNEVCIACHNLDTKAEITGEYYLSQHAAGSTVARSTRNSCAPCHSNEGFIEVVNTGMDTTAAGIPIPTAITCTTCHDFHETLDQTGEGPDYAIRAMDAVELLMYRADGLPAVEIDFENESNLCMNCHQPRHSWDGYAAVIVNDSIDQDDIRFGPHHGTQANILAGLGGFEPAGTVPYPDVMSTTHATGGACVACHMHEQNHEFEPSLDGCNTAECHDGALDTFDVGGKQTEIVNLLAVLRTELETAGLIDVDGDLITGEFPADHVGALYNYLTIEDDRSDGIHNFGYTRALLQNSIEVFN